MFKNDEKSLNKIDGIIRMCEMLLLVVLCVYALDIVNDYCIRGSSLLLMPIIVAKWSQCGNFTMVCF